MSCFWTAILNTLTPEEKNVLGLTDKNSSEYELVVALKKRSNMFDDCRVLWQNEILSKQLCSELKAWVDVYEPRQILNGHDTSSCDPFLTLLCVLFGWKIIFSYQHAVITFENTHNNARTVQFGANSHHFYTK